MILHTLEAGSARYVRLDHWESQALSVAERYLNSKAINYPHSDHLSISWCTVSSALDDALRETPVYEKRWKHQIRPRRSPANCGGSASR